MGALILLEYIAKGKPQEEIEEFKRLLSIDYSRHEYTLATEFPDLYEYLEYIDIKKFILPGSTDLVQMTKHFQGDSSFCCISF